MQAPETELKFIVDNIPAFRSAVARLNLHLRTERSFEENTLFDTPDRRLRSRRQILRIRIYAGSCVLTHKRLADENAPDLRYKIRIETETKVEDCAALAEVFTQLGFRPAFRYEKFRTEWDSPEGGHLVLDETPIGTWAELEGPTAWIDATLEKLAIPSDRCTVESYGALFLRWKEQTGSPAENLTFSEIPAGQLPAPAHS